MRSVRCLLGRVLLRVYRVGELVEVAVERVEKSLHRQPLDAASPPLDTRDVRRVHLQTRGQLLLGESGLVPQDAQCAAEHCQLDVSFGIIHSLGIPGQVVVVSVHRKIVAPAMRGSSGRLAPRASTPGTPAKLPVGRLALLPEHHSRGLQNQGGTMSTNPQGVLSSLLAEDRPWTLDELVREKGDRMEVVDAIAELDALGLVTRINKRVVCASRAAIHADRLDA
jgi:hypothetical protein